MRVVPGQIIPFWYRLWDGNPNRFIVAHLTDVHGVEQSGSPYTLTYSGNRGIYTADGPLMGNVNLLSDYEVYLDPALTLLDTNYLPASDWVQPDVGPPPQLILLNRPLVGTIKPNEISGAVVCEVEAGARIHQDKLTGLVSVPLLTGSVSAPQIQDCL